MNKIKIIPENLSAARGDSKGEINLQWDSAGNGVLYLIEVASSNHSKIIKRKILDIIYDSRYTVKDLKSNKYYFFRAVSINNDGQKQSSEKIIKKAP